jgi:hypothetical protein
LEEKSVVFKTQEILLVVSLSYPATAVNPAASVLTPEGGPPPTDPGLVAEVRETLRLLVAPGAVFELRALYPVEYRVFGSGDLDKAAVWATGQAALEKNVYVTLNSLAESLRETGRAAADGDVVSRRWLLVDIDPERDGTVSATDAEKEQAREVALAVKAWLHEQGFPEPVLADSGNGWHLLYPIDLPAADQGLVKRSLQALAARFNTATVKIDTSVFNPSRITKLYGTVARKGLSDSARPHRKSAIMSVPTDLKVVPTDRLEAVAALAPSRDDQHTGHIPAKDHQQSVVPGQRLRRCIPVPDLSREEAVRLAEAFVSKIPPAVSGHGGHDQTFAVACRLVRDFGLSVEEARPVLKAYNLRCLPPWEEWELDHKLADADEYDGLRGLYLVGFSNYRDEEGKGCRGEFGKQGLSAKVIAENLFNITEGWPKKAGGSLFVPGSDLKPTWLSDPRELFAWIQGQLAPTQQNKLKWAEGTDKMTKSEFHSYLIQKTESYDAVEPYPHYPAISGHYYMHPAVKGGDGRAFADLLDRFNPATPVDRQLIKAMFMTPFWGGPGGARPVFLITCEDEDVNKGRGVGKTSLAEMVGHLAGGLLTFSKEEASETIMKRLLSPPALDKRVCLFDNVKSLKFSSEVLEGLVTVPTLSGRQLYVGDGSRPNTLTYLMTINGATLSKDMAQRCVIIKVRRPVHSGDWAAETRGLIDRRRWEIVGDILAELRREVAPLNSFSRWGQWEKSVLAHCEDPAECQQLIGERQGDVDGDQDEADQVREVFVKDLVKRGFDPEKSVVWYPSGVVADIVNHATGDHRVKQRATGYLNTLAIREIHKKRWDGSRGYVWTGEKSSPGAPKVKYDSTGKLGIVF